MCENADPRVVTFSANDLLKLCRSCLCEVHRDYFSLGGFYLDKKVVDIYKNVTSIEVSAEDNLPKKLCAPCYDHIIKFDLFKNKVLASERKLTENVNVVFDQSDIHIDVHKSELSSINIEAEYGLNQDNDQNESGFDQISDSEDDIPLLDRLKRETEYSEPKCNSEINDDTDNYRYKITTSDLKDNCVKVISDEPEDKPKVKRKKRVKKKETSDGKKKHERRKEPCPECGKVLFTYKMDNHMRTHTKEKPYGCEKCGAHFSERSNLNRHLKIHGNERPYRCERCEKGFLRPSSRAIHEVTAHNTERNVLCPLCGKGFKHQYFLNKHMSNIHHTGEKVKVYGPGYPCPICGNLYRTKSSLTVHKMKHDQPKAFLCNICGNGYSTKAVLENHQRVHTGEKNYTCDICNKKFRFITTLKTHALVHSGEKPLSCPTCNKQFRQHSHLNTHIRGQHSTDRPYQCSYCLKTFKQSCNLTVHTRIHTGETPYHCDICQKGFYDSSSMKKHRKGHFEKTNLAVTWDKLEVNDVKIESVSLQT